MIPPCPFCASGMKLLRPSEVMQVMPSGYTAQGWKMCLRGVGWHIPLGELDRMAQLKPASKAVADLDRKLSAGQEGDEARAGRRAGSPEREFREAAKKFLEVAQFWIADLEQEWRPPLCYPCGRIAFKGTCPGCGKKVKSGSSRQTLGLPDLWIAGHGATAWLELKSSTGRQTPSQEAWEAVSTKNGEHYYLVHSLEELRALVTYLLTRGHLPDTLTEAMEA